MASRSAERYDSLSPGYRHRLERGGIGRTEYIRGDNLSAARGHLSRSALVDRIVSVKTDIEGGEDRTTRDKNREIISKNADNGELRTVGQLRQIEKLYQTAKKRKWTSKQLFDAADEEFGDDFEDLRSAFYYH